MKFDILKIIFLIKKNNCCTSSIIIVIILFVVLFYYYLNIQSLSYFFNFDSPAFDQINSNTFSIKFDVNGPDALVFLHIQKTGGTLLERSLTKDGLINYKCKCIKREKKCNCLNKIGLNWIFSRYSTGWRCGLHADWTELSSCVNEYLNTEAHNSGYIGIKRKTYYFTVLREPINRYLSEWRHVQRGATWRRSKHMCQGRKPTKDELIPCYTDIDWAGVSLSNFMNCKSNLANNRQTRMLADLTNIGCYNESWPYRDEKMLQSAKDNILKMSFFGLLEYITMTQYLFHKTFGLKFVELWIPLNVTHSKLTSITKTNEKHLKQINHLDMALYRFSERIFLTRVFKTMLADRKRIQACCLEMSKEIDWDGLLRKDKIYIQNKLNIINSILSRLLFLDGSRPPSDSVMAQRKDKWQKKIWNDMQTEFDFNEY